MVEDQIEALYRKIDLLAESPRAPYKTSIKGVSDENLEEIITGLHEYVSKYDNLKLTCKKWRKSFAPWTLYPEISNSAYGRAVRVQPEKPQKPRLNPVQLLCKTTAFVYLVECDGRYKIGKSNNVESRILSMQTGSPYKINLIRKYEFNESITLEIERMLHNEFREYNTIGEWFDFRGGNAEELISEFFNREGITPKSCT